MSEMSRENRQEKPQASLSDVSGPAAGTSLRESSSRELGKGDEKNMHYEKGGRGNEGGPVVEKSSDGNKGNGGNSESGKGSFSDLQGPKDFDRSQYLQENRHAQDKGTDGSHESVRPNEKGEQHTGNRSEAANPSTNREGVLSQTRQNEGKPEQRMDHKVHE